MLGNYFLGVCIMEQIRYNTCDYFCTTPCGYRPHTLVGSIACIQCEDFYSRDEKKLNDLKEKLEKSEKSEFYTIGYNYSKIILKS